MIKEYCSSALAGIRFLSFCCSKVVRNLIYINYYWITVQKLQHAASETGNFSTCPFSFETTFETNSMGIPNHHFKNSLQQLMHLWLCMPHYNSACFKGEYMKYEPPHDKTNKIAYAPSEDSDQPGHPRMPKLI